ncbi:MAG: hypothetical protein NW220_01995 [Leptolyngbyaceae cyanobacterium bins.349]|nr:hypothetical protein [Leptolyngbyaceae cyanobacterium bins.349]
MNFKHNQNTIAKLTGAIAATAFLSVSAILPQAAFSQQSPGAVGDPRVDEPNTNTRINDPSRPINEQNRPLNAPNSPSRSDAPSGQMNNTGVGGGTGGMNNVDGSRPERPENRIEKYTQPGATDPSRSTEFTPPANSPSRSNSSGQMNDQMNNTGTGGGAGGTVNQNRGSDRYTAPSTTTPGRGTYTTPSTQINRTSGPNSGNVDNQINNSTFPGAATPGTGSNNNSGGSNTGGGAGGSGAVPGLW